jgi:hypothetical protein
MDLHALLHILHPFLLKSAETVPKLLVKISVTVHEKKNFRERCIMHCINVSIYAQI